MSLVFLDTETTGLTPESADLIELSAVRFDGKRKGKKFDSLVLPFSDIPPMIEKLTGINNEMIKKAPLLSRVRTDFCEKYLQAGDILVAHNVAFDVNFLNHKEFDLENPTIDTFDLATLILPKEKSFSLEVLSENFGIIHKNAHRAMSDVLAMVELWKKMQDIVRKNWTKKVFQQILPIIQKSTWAGKVFFEDLEKDFAKKKDDPQMSLFEEDVKDSLSFSALEKELATHVHNEGKNAYELPSEVSTENLALLVAKNFTEQTAISTKRNNLGLPVFDRPENFLDSEKLDDFLQRESFNKDETLMLIRILLSGAKHFFAFNLRGAEVEIFYKYLAGEKDCSQDAPVLFVPVGALDLFQGKNLIMANSNELADELERINKTTSASRFFERVSARTKEQDRFLDGLFFGFGLIAKYIRERTQESSYPEHLKIIPADDHSLDFKNFAEGFVEAEKEFANFFPEEDFLLTALNEWKDFFAVPSQENELKILTVFPDNSVAFSRVPISLSTYLKKIWQNKKSVSLLAHHFPKNPESGDLIFPLQDQCFDLKVFTGNFDWQKSLFVAPANARNGDEKDAGKIARQIQELTLSQKGNIVAVLTSVVMTERVAAILEQNKLPHVCHLYGNVSKSTQKFASDEAQVILTTARHASNLIRESKEGFTTYYLQKFSFDPFKNPLIEARQELCDNSFMDFSLPRAIARFIEIINSAATKNKPFVFFCADPKILASNSWAKHFFDALPEEMPKKFLDMEQIKKLLAEF